jgi:hypothetical protein
MPPPIYEWPAGSRVFALAPSGDFLAFVNQGDVEIWRLGDPPKRSVVLKSPMRAIFGLTFTTDSRRLAVTGLGQESECLLKIFHIADGTLDKEWEIDNAEHFEHIDFIPNSNLAVCKITRKKFNKLIEAVELIDLTKEPDRLTLIENCPGSA